jgi:hypothetical protein
MLEQEGAGADRDRMRAPTKARVLETYLRGTQRKA